MSTRKIRISIRSHERIFISSTTSLALVCAFCEEETRFFPPEVAACLAGTTIRSIFRAVEDGRLHFIESEDKVFICSRSLEIQARVPHVNVISIEEQVS